MSAFALTVPDFTTMGGFALAASSSLKIGDRANVPGTIISIGSVVTSIGNAAKTGPIISSASVTLAGSAKVTGDVRSGGTVTLAAGATISGTKVQNSAVPTRTRTINIDFGSGPLGAVTVNAGQTVSKAPGSYKVATVNGNGILKLRTGMYYFTSLTLNSGSQVQLDDVSGPISIFVKGAAILRTSWNRQSAGGQSLLVASLGTTDIPVEGNFEGTVLAPSAKLLIGNGGPFIGQAYAKSIDVAPDRVWNQRTLGRWTEILVPDSPANPPVLGFSDVSTLFPKNAVGDALVGVLTGAYSGSSGVGGSLTTLRTQPAPQVVVALMNAIDAAPDPQTKHALVGLAVMWNAPEAQTIYANVLSFSHVPPGAQIPSGVRHDEALSYWTEVPLAAVRGVTKLAVANVAAARTLLVDVAVGHPLDAVRSMSIRNIVRLADTQLLAQLNSRISQADRRWLTLRQVTAQDLTLGAQAVMPNVAAPAPALPPQTTANVAPTSPVSMPPPASSAILGASGVGGPCTVATAVDLGTAGNPVTVWNGGCVRVKDAYPANWGEGHAMLLESTSGGSYPVPFTWAGCNQGYPFGGSGTFTSNWQGISLPTTGVSCPTLIDLQGPGTGTITLRYWSN